MRVLLATDGSKDARAAAEWLREWPLPAGSAISVISAAVVPQGPIDIPTITEFKESMRAEARRAAEEARVLLGGRGAGATVRVEDADPHGDPRETLLAAADSADLVVVGARGLTGVKGFLLGSVSTAIARHARAAVLVTKGRPRPPRHVLVAVDGSDGARHAVDFLASLEDLREINVRLLGVVQAIRFPSSAPAGTARLRAALEDLYRERSAEMAAVVRAAGTPLEGKVAGLEVSVTVGAPSEEIVRAANREGNDLVVVGARGLGLMKRLVLGSVSEKVLRYARCPVLIVKRR